MKTNNNEESIVFGRIVKRSALGAVIGWVVGMAFNPPFKGITTTPNDVQGLVYFSWMMTSGIGLVFGAIAGLIGKRPGDPVKRKELVEPEQSARQ